MRPDQVPQPGYGAGPAMAVILVVPMTVVVPMAVPVLVVCRLIVPVAGLVPVLMAVAGRLVLGAGVRH
jgi:hypothetical protein